jgi:hypothetical protein
VACDVGPGGSTLAAAPDRLGVGLVVAVDSLPLQIIQISQAMNDPDTLTETELEELRECADRIMNPEETGVNPPQNELERLIHLAEKQIAIERDIRDILRAIWERLLNMSRKL